MSKPFHAGKAAMDGILAAQLAAEGFESATNLLDADKGLQGTFIQDHSVRIPPVRYDDGWEILRNGFKPYACCRSIHAAVDAARQLAPQVSGQAIEHVHVKVHKNATVPAPYVMPTTPLQGKFSIPFCIALALRGYRVVAADFSVARLSDPAVMTMVPQVHVEEVPNQERWAAHIDVVLAGGNTLHAAQHVVRGHPDNPMMWDDMEHKFVGLVEPVLGAETHSLWHALRDFEAPGQLVQVLHLVRRQG
jgi:2-methylcitrate dehydratase PrpD